MHIELEWDGATGYPVTTPTGGQLGLDSDNTRGTSPMQTLLAAVAACMAIDVIHILRRMRAEPDQLRARASGQRADDHPRRFRTITLEFRGGGDGVTGDRLQRAVALSFEKYCSVMHSLAADIEYNWSARIDEGETSGFSAP